MNRTFLLICFAVFLLSVSITYALDYSDFPENLQWVLNYRIEQLQETGGFCIAGRITFDDGAKIFDSGDVAISVDDKVSEPIPVYYGGWFIMRKALDSKCIGTENKVRVILRAFEYEPVDAYVAVDVNRPTYLEFQMKKTPDKKLCEVKGTVFDENRLPLEGAFVSLYAIGCHFPESEQTMFTGPDGRYRFPGISQADYNIKASAPGYADCYAQCRPSPESAATTRLDLYPHRRIYIEYVYQPNGSPSFESGDLLRKALYWKHDNAVDMGLVFSRGIFTRYLNDLTLRQKRDVLYFGEYYGTSEHTEGFYDEGIVDFNAVLVGGDNSKYTQRGDLRCQVGHVYVVKTLEGPCYAKFIVLTDEYSFRTVNPTRLKSYYFAGYDLEVEMASCSGTGKVYASKFYDAPQGLNINCLPYYWELSGLEGLEFSANITIEYNKQDIRKFGLAEESLVLYQYVGFINTWRKVSSGINPAKNQIFAKDITSWGLFSIGSE